MAGWSVRDHLKELLDVVATIAVIVLCGTATWALVWARPITSPRPSGPIRPAARPEPPVPSAPIALDGGVRRGSDRAKVALIEYSEFKCPFCGQFARDTQSKITQKYIDTGRVVQVFKHFPLDSLHPFARQAAEGAVCASRQGKFWELHDKMFANQKSLEAIEMARQVRDIGLETQKFSKCMKEDAAAAVQADVVSGEALGVTGTPTFFVGLVQDDGRVRLTQRLTGSQPFQNFEKALDAALDSVGRASR